MKKKILDRKLVLNKRDIANIGNHEMNHIKGGTSDRYSDCVGVSFCGTEPRPSKDCSDENSECVGVSFCGV